MWFQSWFLSSRISLGFGSASAKIGFDVISSRYAFAEALKFASVASPITGRCHCFFIVFSSHFYPVIGHIPRLPWWRHSFIPFIVNNPPDAASGRSWLSETKSHFRRVAVEISALDVIVCASYLVRLILINWAGVIATWEVRGKKGLIPTRKARGTCLSLTSGKGHSRRNVCLSCSYCCDAQFAFVPLMGYDYVVSIIYNGYCFSLWLV